MSGSANTMTAAGPGIGRRGLLSGAMLALLGGLAGCGASSRASEPSERAASARPAMLVHRDPGCGCCEAWADLARAEGYAVKVVDHADMIAVKRRLGVPPQLAACHTAEVAGAVVEGHVPFAALARFLDERPAGAVGIAVAGMPVGSPGMEVPGQEAEPLVVHAFDAAGASRPYWSSPGSAARG